MIDTKTNSKLSSNNKANIKYEDIKDDDLYERQTSMTAAPSSCGASLIPSTQENRPSAVDLDYVIFPRHIGDGCINYNHKKAKEMVIRKIIQK